MQLLHILTFIILLTLFTHTYFFIKLSTMISEIGKPIEVDEGDGTPIRDENTQPSSYDIMRMEREREFDNRIDRIKDELANKVADGRAERKGGAAEILHPDIQNLPHEEIKIKYDLYPIEIAE